MKRSRSDITFDLINNAFMIIIIIVMLYPMYFTIIASLSEPSEVALGNVTWIPKGFSLYAYINVFRSSQIWIGYRNTIFYTVMGTFLSLVLTLPAAYVMSKKKLHGRPFFSWFILITMFFGGGLIPFYLLVKDLDLLNKPYTLIVLGSVGASLIIIARIYYQTSIPEELYESARVDGCSNFGQFFMIGLPLSAPIIAVMALFYAVGRWNDYFTAMIFISRKDFYPLQLVLRNILIQGQMALAALQMPGHKVEDAELLYATKQAYLAEAMKYALIFIASAPLLAAYPFVQKYFVKGMLVGSLKG
jgi:putative aldouronate transport system permease protein